jgi:hypothetical protein
MRLSLWFVLALVLFFIWIGSFVMYHVAGFLIHVLLLVAVLALIVHLVTGRRAR